MAFKLKPVSLKTFGRNVALTPAAGLFALGGAINKASGGKTATYNIYKAANKGGSAKTTYSTLTQAASGYQGTAPGKGTWAAPVLNKQTPVFVGKTAASIVTNVVAPVADATSKGLFGMSLHALAWTAAGVGAAVLVAPPLIERALK